MENTKNFWDEKFSETSDYYYGTEANAFLQEACSKNIFCNPNLPKKALLLGDGEGRNGVWLAKKGFTVKTIDISTVAISKSKALAQQHNCSLHWLQGDVSEASVWPDETFSMIIVIYLHLSEKMQIILHELIKKHLSPSGLAIFEVFSKRQLDYQQKHESGGPRNIDFLYSLERLRQDFSDYKMVYLAETETFLQEGLGHQGLASVIRMIAQKPDYPHA